MARTPQKRGLLLLYRRPLDLNMHPMEPSKWPPFSPSSPPCQLFKNEFRHTAYEPLSPSELIRSMSNSNLTRYMQAQYYPTSHVPANAHVIPPMPREDNAQRKRPKYTRSKTGCLTCRAKKIKCDESKPTCIRCTHGQRDCTWPDTIPVASNSTSQMPTADDFDGLLSTAESSGISDASSPPTRHHTPPIGHHLHLSLPTLALRRQSEPYLHINQIPHQPAHGRRQSVADFDLTPTVQDHPMHGSKLNLGATSIIPEIASYPSRPRYENNYPSTMHPLVHPVPRRGTSKTRVGDRFMPHPASSTQCDPPIMPSLDPIDPFFQNAQERNLIRHYCNNSLSIVMAVPSENPIVAANLPLVLSKPRGSDSPSEALRSALLGVAAVHQSFCWRKDVLHRTGRNDANCATIQNTLEAASDQGCSAAEGTRSDASLAAARAILLLDIFSGGQHWSKDMDLAKNLVRLHGGPAFLLSRSTPASPGLIERISGI